jgi:xanthine dehydrogenase YagS FAD-binding subunit
MKSFTPSIAGDLAQAVSAAKAAHAQGQRVAFAGGGSDLLALMKDRVATPDVLIYLKSIKALDAVTPARGGLEIGGQITLTSLGRNESVRRQYPVLAQAAETVATPQIRNVATLAGNVCQRPWCWYFRNGFPCLKNGGTTCFSAAGENQFHAIFGGGPSYIVHPSDTAPALVALDAVFRIVGPSGNRTVPAAQFFALPTLNPARENVLSDDEVLADITIPAAAAGMRSGYHKVMDREVWTHAIVSAAVALQIDRGVCKAARVVLGGVAPVPWRLSAVEQMLTGQRITPELSAQAGAKAIEGARPLQKNRYKVPMTQALVARAILDVAQG